MVLRSAALRRSLARRSGPVRVCLRRSPPLRRSPSPRALSWSGGTSVELNSIAPGQGAIAGPEYSAGFFAANGPLPVGVENLFHFADDFPVANDNADLTTLVQLELPQALAADERAASVAHHRAHVQPPAAQLLHLREAELFPLLLEAADDADAHAARRQ